MTPAVSVPPPCILGHTLNVSRQLMQHWPKLLKTHFRAGGGEGSIIVSSVESYDSPGQLNVWHPWQGFLQNTLKYKLKGR